MRSRAVDLTARVSTIIVSAHNVVLAPPGNAFSVSQTASGFLRFNVAQCADERIFKVLKAAMRP